MEMVTAGSSCHPVGLGKQGEAWNHCNLEAWKKSPVEWTHGLLSRDTEQLALVVSRGTQ